LEELQRDTGVSIVFVSHDLAVIAEIADRVVVMYAGEVVEQARAEDLFVTPTHPYTAGLLGAIPRLGSTRHLEAIAGRVPSPGAIPAGCRFHPRCRYAVAGRCDTDPVPMVPGPADSTSRCVRVGELDLIGVEVR